MRLTYWHHRLQNTKLYWSARKRVRYLLFRAKALLFVFARKKQTFGENLRHFLFLIQVVSTGAVSSFAFVALSNVLIHTIPENLSFEIFSTTVYIDNIFNLRKELGFRDDLFVMAQVAGVFLGLYFTAVTVVVGTTYANLRNEIRNLIWRDSTNRLYMAALAFLGGLCITQAIFLSVGLSINTITYIFSLALILVAIFGFIPMSVRVFQFFNPTILFKAYAVPDFLKFAERACVDGERWDDPNFQNHYGEEAQNRLAIISNAVEIACANPEIWKSSYSDLSVSIASLLKNYCIKKKKIPSGSYWYRTYLGHKSWFSVDASEADIAAQLGSRLPPKKRLHRQWVEDNMTRLLNRLVDRAFADNDFSKIYDISLTMQNVFITFSENGAIKEAHDMWHQFTKPTLKKLETIAKPQSESEQGLLIGSVDAQAACVTVVFHSYQNYLDRVSQVDNVDSAARARSLKETLPLEFSNSLVPKVEQEFSEFRMDAVVEGTDPSPMWFKQQRIARAIGEDVGEHVAGLERILNELHPLTEQMRTNGCMTISNVAAFRGLESCKKAEGLEEKLSHLKTMMKTKWYVSDLPWPDIGNDKLRETNSSARDVFLRVIARTGIAWDFRAWDEADVPDFFGQTYWLLGDECYSSLEEGHFEKFKELFPIFFMMGLYAAEGFRGQIQRDSSRRNLIGFRDMFLDMMAISGYAAAHSEMQSVDYWDVVRSEWDKAIGETYGLSASYNLMKMAMELDKGFFGAMTARSIARTKWSQEFARFMRSSGLAVGYEDTLVGVGGSGSTNEFLRAIERTNSFHPNPEEFFVARLAVERDEMDSETLTPQVKQFIREWGKWGG